MMVIMNHDNDEHGIMQPLHYPAIVLQVDK